MLTFYRKTELMGLRFRVKEYSVAEIFEAIDTAEELFQHRAVLSDGVMFSIYNDCIFLFKNKGTICVKCNLEATHFVLESHDEAITPYLNLYARIDDKEIIFTKDHIFPKSKGGPDKHFNYQTMCSPCNKKKGNKVDEEVITNKVDAA